MTGTITPGLRIGAEADFALGLIVHRLRTVRVEADIHPAAVAARVPVLPGTVYSWECRATKPVLDNLMLWADVLERRLIIMDGGVESARPLRRRPGEAWLHFERRRLVAPLRDRRRALRVTQAELGARIGVSRDSVIRWELADTPPRPIALAVWAHELGFRLGLGSAGRPDAAVRLRRLRDGLGASYAHRDVQGDASLSPRRAGGWGAVPAAASSAEASCRVLRGGVCCCACRAGSAAGPGSGPAAGSAGGVRGS